LQIIETNIEGVLLIEPEVFRDRRGHFLETYSKKLYAEHGLDEDFVQDNFSHSKKGILRGLHYQLKNPQGKLVRVTKGSVFDVAVDIRQNSKTFGQYFSIILDDVKFHQLYMPAGIAHGFFVISEVDFEYKCTDYYYPNDQHGIYWNDDTLDINWPSDEVILSDQDLNFSRFSDKEPNELPFL